MYRIFIFLLIIFFSSSCSTKKDILYLQSNKDFDSDFLYKDYVLKVDDILKISIRTDELISIDGNLIDANQNNVRNYAMEGYQVSTSGHIFYPQIGQIYVLGKNINQIRELIQDSLIQNEIFKSNPIVDIKLANSHVIILGEVNSPGRHEFLENNLNIFEAISLAGDLTINGKRDDVKIIRDSRGKQIISSIDLTDNNLFSSEFFQINSGDIILVNPNTNRIKNAGIIGNAGNLLSLLSFLTSTIILISNIN